MTGLEIRPARADELPLVGELTVSAFLAAGYLAPDDGYVSHLRDTAARADAAELLVATAGGTLIGTVTYCPGGSPFAELAGRGEADFRMLAVAPEARGQGIGEALVRACIERARAAGCTSLRLSTLPSMRAARRIYERLGFVRTPERDWYPGSGTLLITYAMELT